MRSRPGAALHLVCVLTITYLLGACSMLEVKSQAETLGNVSIIRGSVEKSTAQQGPLNVLVFEIKDGLPNYDGAGYVSEQGEYQFYVTPGVYQIAAHVDVNKDGVYQADEHMETLPETTNFEVLAGETKNLPTLNIRGLGNTDERWDVTKANSIQYENIGKVLPLSSPLYSRENYTKGFWKPMDFLMTVGGGLFLLEEYDPKKKPILFVHGINGGPTDWEPVINQLDTELYQPWVFYYASGMQLDIVSDTLVQGVIELHKRYQFETMSVAAHSMGGLVTRSFVKKIYEQYPKEYTLIDLVLTVNTPMRGMGSAAHGVKMSPIVVQSWRDVATGSDFVEALSAWQWPEDIPYYLFFSFIEGKGGDGVVAIENQIPYFLQREAVRSYGFNNTHVGTLSDNRFIEEFNMLVQKKNKN